MCVTVRAREHMCVRAPKEGPPHTTFCHTLGPGLSNKTGNSLTKMSTPASVCSACWDIKTAAPPQHSKRLRASRAVSADAAPPTLQKPAAMSYTAIQTFWHHAKMPVRSPRLRCRDWSGAFFSGCWKYSSATLGSRLLYMQSQCEEFMWQEGPLSRLPYKDEGGDPMTMWREFV